MPVPHVSGSFGDLLDPRFQKVFDDELSQLDDMIPSLYSDAGSNGRDEMKWTETGTVPDFTAFSGTVGYQSVSQGYDVTATPLEFTNGVQVERKLFDDDQFHVMDQRPRGLANSAMRTRQGHGARIFNSAFSIDSLLYSHSEGVPLCSNSHTTTSGASTAAGFDNLGTAALSATAVAAARIQMRGFRGDQAERISVIPDELWVPVDLFEEAWEITHSTGKLDTGNNNANVLKGVYEVYEWEYMTDTNNWFMCDSRMRRQHLHWTDRIPLEFAMIEDFDTLVAKWRGYMRYAFAYTNWRWLFGSQVA